MARRRPHRDPAPSRRRRPPERRSGTNLGPLIGFTFGIGVVILIAIIATKTFQQEPKDAQPDAGRPAQSETQQAPTQQAPTQQAPTQQATAKPSGLPAPDLTGEMIIHGDQIFKDVKKLFAAARRAKEADDDENHARLLAEAQKDYDKIGRHFQRQVDWLLDAQGNGWKIPKTYQTLQRRLARYADWRRKNLPGESGKPDKGKD